LGQGNPLVQDRGMLRRSNAFRDVFQARRCARANSMRWCGRSFQLIGLILALSGCGRSLDRAALVFMNGAEPEPLDPALITAQASGRVAYALLEGLTAFDR